MKMNINWQIYMQILFLAINILPDHSETPSIKFHLPHQPTTSQSPITTLRPTAGCIRYHHHSTTIWQHTNTLFTWLVSQPAINIFLSYQINTSHQQCFSFITNQHQPLTTAKRTEWITSSPGQGQETGPIWWQHISIHLVVRHGSSGQPHHDLAMGPFGVYTGIQKPT